MYANNDIDNKKMDCVKIAAAIAKWCEDNYGYFVRANGDKQFTIKDLTYQISTSTKHLAHCIKSTLRYGFITSTSTSTNN